MFRWCSMTGHRSTGTLASRIAFLVALWAVLAGRTAEASDEEEKTTRIVGIVGGSADLPCDVDVSNCGKVYFITWTKNVSNEWKRLYLYSDAVDKPLQELAYPDRADFYLQESSAYLRIHPLRIEDDGTYKCDVTYVQGKCPSLSFATLITHAPPSVPSIEKDGKAASNGSIVGPFYEGTALNLECETYGGKPTPVVSWLKDGEEIDSESYGKLEKNGASSVTSVVKVTLDRDDLGAKIECRVNNEAIDEVLVSWVEIDLHVGPSSLEVEGPTAPVVAGEYMTLMCTIEGAKPAANATWFNRSEVLNVTPETQVDLTADGTFTTISTVEVPVSRHDDQGLYYCKGSNSVLQIRGDAPLLKSLDIEVLYPPAVVMQPLDGITVNESDTAIVQCTYTANPFNVTDIQWFHEDKRLAVPTQGKYEGSLQGYPVLTIKGIQKKDRGDYSCSLANTIGRGNASNYAGINVHYPPTVEATISPEDAKEGNSISLFCDLVDGNPQELLRVIWYRDGDQIHDISNREIVWVGVYRNSSGVYSCRGENDAGWGERSEEKELMVKYLPGPAELVELDPPAIKGNTSFLHCKVEELGLPPADVYRWEKDGELLATTSSPNYTTEVHGVTSRGNYSCAAVNEGVGVGPKGFTYISVYAPPLFIQDLPDIQGAAKNVPHVTLECKVECEPLCEIRWARNGVPISNSNLYTVRKGITPEDVLNNRFRSVSSKLRFELENWPGRRLERDRDRANYTCYTTGNSAGDGISSTMLFLVEYAPEAMSLSESIVQVQEGEVPPNIECTASSWPPSTYLWRWENIVLARDDVLSFNDSVTRQYHGEYICVAENTHGKAQIELTLEVLYKPDCTISESTNKQGEAVLICKADGFPKKINFTWSKDNDTSLDDDFDMDSDHDDFSVYILPDTSERYGLYVCIAINDVGESKPCEIFVSGPGLAGWHAEFGDKNVLVIAAVIGSIAILFVLAIIIIILIMRKRRLRSFASPGKAPLGSGGDGLYQNVSGPPSGSKQNGPQSPDAESNVMYENMPFHRQGPVPSFPSGRMRQSLPADFSRAYQNVLYCNRPSQPQQQQQQPQQQWNTGSEKRRSKGQREPCPQHGMLPEVLQHRENGGTVQVCDTFQTVVRDSKLKNITVQKFIFLAFLKLNRT